MLDYDRAIEFLKRENLATPKLGVNLLIPDKRPYDLCFIDGGNAEIISSPHISLQAVKACALFFESNRLSSIKQDKHLFTIKSADGSYEITEPGKSGFMLRSNKDIKEVGGIVRNLAELRFCKEVKKEFGGLVVKDGGFECTHELERAELEQLDGICGLSKTSMETLQGSPITALINTLPGCWYAEQDKVFAVKLNQFSNHVFKLELRGLEISSVMQALLSNSNDYVYPGYPYGLILADQYARISNGQASSLKTYFETKAGKDWKKIQVWENALNAHKILDKLVF